MGHLWHTWTHLILVILMSLEQPTNSYQRTSKLLINCLWQVTVTLVNTGRSAPAFWENNGNMDFVMVINWKDHASLLTSTFLMNPHPKLIPVAATFILYWFILLALAILANFSSLIRFLATLVMEWNSATKEIG